ncbi:MAG: penicillin-binding protein 2 [Rickettsiaceae bacterium]|nr:penicillin-binding protein 2 [Rickettsiaceae bacterium]
MRIFGSFFSTLREWIKTNQHTITSGLTSWDNSQKSIYMRLTIVAAAFGFFFTTVSYRVLSVALSHHAEKKGYFAKNVSRREIVDRNNNLLAVNIPASSVFANPQHMIDIEKDITKLAKAVPGIDKNKLISELKKDGKTFVWVKRDLTPKEQQTIHDLGIAGLYFENEERRLYTYGTVASHILGHVGRDGKGLAGIEKNFDDFLNHDNHDETGEDTPLQLTLDIRVQNIVSQELDKVIAEFNATGGVGIVADPNTGEILALVSKPDFDPHNPSKANDEQLFNRASLGIYELGSIMKCITLAVGFDSKTITLHDAYNLSNFRVGKFQVKDYHKEEGWHSVADVFLNSSNIGSTQIALEIGQEKFRSYYKKLGLLDQVKLDIPERGYPLFQKTSDWSDITLTTMSYGYGVSISPLHFVQAMIPVVNGGYMHKLKLVKKTDDGAETSEKVLDESTSDAMRKLLRLVVSKGTGKKAEVAGYFVGGKTGTANKREGKGYVNNNRMSSFFGTMPSINPKYVVLVMLDEPKPSKNSFGFATAGWNAAPATGAILSRIAALYGMRPYDTNLEVEEQLEVDYQIDSET